jgi:hypothetical protein
LQACHLEEERVTQGLVLDHLDTPGGNQDLDRNHILRKEKGQVEKNLTVDLQCQSGGGMLEIGKIQKQERV